MTLKQRILFFFEKDKNEKQTNKEREPYIDSRVFTGTEIKKYLKEEALKVCKIEIHKSIDSTNTFLKEKAARGEPEWSIVIAEEQTGGRGRLGRSFYSPSQSGIYMSVLVRPDISAQKAVLLTACTAVAVAKAIESVSGETAYIKWVNDIYCKGKKVCGILAESSVNFEKEKLEYAVIGIGVNAAEPEKGFPNEIKDIAGVVFEKYSQKEEAKNKLTAEIINNLFEYLTDLEGSGFLGEYRKRSFLMGKNVEIFPAAGGPSAGTALVTGVDENAGLIVKTEDGIIKTLNSGEVSVRQL